MLTAANARGGTHNDIWMLKSMVLTSLFNPSDKLTFKALMNDPPHLTPPGPECYWGGFAAAYLTSFNLTTPYRWRRFTSPRSLTFILQLFSTKRAIK